MDETFKNALIQAISVGLIIVLLFSTYALFKIDQKIYEKILYEEKQVCQDNKLELINNEENYLICYDKITKQTTGFTRTGKEIKSTIPWTYQEQKAKNSTHK